jgi:hypothetical protein
VIFEIRDQGSDVHINRLIRSGRLPPAAVGEIPFGMPSCGSNTIIGRAIVNSDKQQEAYKSSQSPESHEHALATWPPDKHGESIRDWLSVRATGKMAPTMSKREPIITTTVRRLRPAQIRADADTQSRARIDETTVAEYAERMGAGDCRELRGGKKKVIAHVKPALLMSMATNVAKARWWTSASHRKRTDDHDPTDRSYSSSANQTTGFSAESILVTRTLLAFRQR